MHKRRDTLVITETVLDAIARTIADLPAEQGGLLGGSYEDGVVRYYYFDHTSARSGATYSPDHVLLTKLLETDWNPRGVRLLGFVHSHPPGCSKPSGGDLVYARRILEAIPDLPRLLLPIITKPVGCNFDIGCFAAIRNGKDLGIQKVKLKVVKECDEDVRQKVLGQEWLIKTSTPSFKPLMKVEDAPPPEVIFKRVHSAYDLNRTAITRLVVVGCGGAISFIESCARTGIGEFVLVDPDTVDFCNLGTQNVYLEDKDKPKVKVVASRIRSINPSARVVCRLQRLEEIDDQAFGRLATEPFSQDDLENGVSSQSKPMLTLLLGLTDNFEAQARINRLALNLGLPAVCAQVYFEGRGAEITFTYPGITPACQRCALSSRYSEYLEKNYRNDVTSDGTPIWSTERLNALKGEIVMAIIHHGTGHPRYGKLLSEIGPRNLVQIRMDPHVDRTLGLVAFNKVFAEGDPGRILYDEAIWLPQKPDCPANGYPACPDCGGTGDLRDAIGTFRDTRPMRLMKEEK